MKNQLTQAQFAKGSFLRRRMELWLKKIFPPFPLKDDAIASIVDAPNGNRFIIEVSNHIGLEGATLIAENCGDWATEVLNSLTEIDKAKAILYSLSVPKLLSGSSIIGTTLRCEPIVFAASHCFNKMFLEISVDPWESDYKSIHPRFVQSASQWADYDRMISKWDKIHQGLNSPTQLDFSNCLKNFILEDKANGTGIFSALSDIKIVRDTSEDDFQALFLWTIYKNTFELRDSEEI